MRYPWVNVALLLLLLAQAITGYFGFTNGVEGRRWLLWLHGVGAYAIALLLLWKSGIILDVYRRGLAWSGRRLGFLSLLLLLLITLATGLVWTFYGPLYLGGFSLVTLHIFLAVGLMALLLWHTWHMRFILHHPAARGRRLFLRALGLTAVGGAVWAAVGRAKSAFAFPGALRRFTGSYETGSFTGFFPPTSWIADYPPPIDATQWRLVIEGAVERPLSFTYDEIVAMVHEEETATLDCTGGWYSTQVWQGVPVARLLVAAGVMPAAQSVTFEAVSGYNRRFSLEEVQGCLLATHVAGRPLAHGHGFPLRLVAPGRRGFNWVKWLTFIRVNESSEVWQPPLPLR